MRLFVYHYLFILSLCFGANIKTGFLKSRVSEGALKANLRHLRVGHVRLLLKLAEIVRSIRNTKPLQS